MVEMVTKHLKNGDRIRMNGLGILEVKDRPAQMGRNPGTGQPIQIAASKKVAFHVAKELKDACRTSSKTPPFNGGGQFAARVFLSDLDAQLEAFALAQGAPPR